MARKLTSKQMKIIDQFINNCKNERFWADNGDTWGNSPYDSPSSDHHGVTALSGDNIPENIYKSIRGINDYETLEQDVQRYIYDTSFKIAHNWRNYGKR